MPKSSERPTIRLGPNWGAYSAPPDPLAAGRGLVTPSQEPHYTRSRLCGPRLGPKRTHGFVTSRTLAKSNSPVLLKYYDLHANARKLLHNRCSALA